MKDTGLPEPKSSTQGIFSVTFMKRAKFQSATDGTLSDRLNSREKRVLQMLSEALKLKTHELSSLTEVSIPTLSRTLKNLIDLELIEYRGAKKTGGSIPSCLTNNFEPHSIDGSTAYDIRWDGKTRDDFRPKRR
jgi:ATP-dependent DNA helicase RecG